MPALSIIWRLTCQARFRGPTSKWSFLSDLRATAAISWVCVAPSPAACDTAEPAFLSTGCEAPDSESFWASTLVMRRVTGCEPSERDLGKDR